MAEKNYDFICSLGGNCAAAHNLRYRKMRFFSLPFDWTYILNDGPIYKFADGLKNHFVDFFKKENLVELKGEEYNPNHKEHAQYKDTYSGYYFVNHFKYNLDKEYNSVNKKMRKRFLRLENSIKRANKILFILSTSFYTELGSITYLKSVLEELYPNKIFNFVVVNFDCWSEENFNIDDIQVYRYKRSINEYDFIKTNIEWKFLDGIKLNKKFVKLPPLKIQKLKKGVSVAILPMIFSIFYIKLYLFGFRLWLSLGKIKEE